MTSTSDPVLQALVDSAVNGTGGSQGWLLAVRADALEVVAASGPTAGAVIGRMLPADAGTAGFVVGSGQPVALVPRGDDPNATSGVAESLDHRPSSLLCVPCESDAGVAGALEIIDKAAGGAFTFDDVELATLLAGIAGTALHSQTAPAVRVPGPAELAAELQRLADADPGRYAALAGIVTVLISSG